MDHEMWHYIITYFVSNVFFPQKGVSGYSTLIYMFITSTKN